MLVLLLEEKEKEQQRSRKGAGGRHDAFLECGEGEEEVEMAWGEMDGGAEGAWPLPDADGCRIAEQEIAMMEQELGDRDGGGYVLNAATIGHVHHSDSPKLLQCQGDAGGNCGRSRCRCRRCRRRRKIEFYICNESSSPRFLLPSCRQP